MTLLSILIIIFSFMMWIFIGQEIISHLRNIKGKNISTVWEWNPLWLIGWLLWFFKKQKNNNNVI